MPIVGLGIDLVEIERVARLVSRDEGIFRARILSESERLQIPAATSQHRRVTAYARSIAAKEAFFKALGTGLTQGMCWPDVEVIAKATSKPVLEIRGEAARVLSGLRADGIQLSLSSSGDSGCGQVTAIVLLTRDEARAISL